MRSDFSFSFLLEELFEAQLSLAPQCGQPTWPRPRPMQKPVQQAQADSGENWRVALRHGLLSRARQTGVLCTALPLQGQTMTCGPAEHSWPPLMGP